MIRLDLNSILLSFLIVFNIPSEGATVNKNENLIVETNVGSIRGLRADDGNYTMFMGIPFATVNESNVFGSAIPYPPFEGVFDAYDDSAICPQIEEYNNTAVGSLDCLHINIYVPDSASPDNPLPVLVNIYGGGFVIGFAGRFSYGPKYLVRHDVILVSFNYRLGPYGFMCLDTPEIPGNQGLKDQVLALRWVRNNIRAFGGDPDQVTVFGNSAGGMAIGLHLVSETERLFTRAIMQSGNAFHPRIAPPGDLSLPFTLAESLGFVTDDMNEALEFLSNADVDSVVEVAPGFGMIGACVEKSFPGVERFLGEIAINSNHSKVAGADILLGFNSVEFPNAVTLDIVFHVMLLSGFNFNEAQMAEAGDIVRRFYIGDRVINDDVAPEIRDYLGDISFVYPTIRSIEPLLEAGAENVYQYIFAYDGGRNIIKMQNNVTLPGAIHADEIGYLFDMQILPDEPTPEDQLTIDRLTTMWTNFAKYGDPTPETNSLLPVKWEPITKESPYHYMIIDSNLSLGQRYEHRRMAFWDLFYQTYKQYQSGYIESDQDDQDSGDGDENENEVNPEPSSASIFYVNSFLTSILVILSLIQVNK